MTNKFFKLGVLVVLTMLFSALAIAQTTWYVNSTNGDDLIYNGLSAVASGPSTGPFKTIAKAVSSAASGDIISIAAGAYTEGNVSIGQNLTLVSTNFLASNVVTIQNGITISTAAKTINLGRTADGSLQFNLGSTGTALVLTAGTLNIDAANVTVASGGTITRTAGTLNATPTVTNANVTYTNTASIAAGPEMPAALGTGSLLVSSTAGTTLTFSNPISIKGGVTVTSGNATFDGAISFDAGSSAAPNGFINSGTGTATVNGGLTWTTYGGQNFAVNAIENNGGTLNIGSTVSFVHATTGASDVTGATIQNGSGTLTIASLVNTPATISSTSYKTVINVLNSATGTFTFTGSAAVTGTATNSSTGKIVFAGGTVSGAATNSSTGTIELTAATTFAGNLTNASGGTVKLNSNTLTMSGATPTLDNTGSKIISATTITVGTGLLSFTGSGAATLTPGSELPGIVVNHSNASTGGVTIGAAATLYGDLTVTSGTLTINGATDVKGATTVNGGTLSLGTNNLTATGSYSQTSGTLTFGANQLIAKGNVSMTGGSVTPGTGTLAFGSGTATGSDQLFTPIPNLTIYNFVVNNPTRKVTMGASVIVTGDFTITAGSVELSTYNVRMQGAAKTFTNTGGYTSSGGGTLIFEAAGTVTGTGTFSNLDVRTGGATYVRLGSNITFSGVLYLRGGDLDIENRTLTFSDVLVRPQIYKSVVPTGGGSANIVSVGGGGGGAIAWNAGATTYDLTYYGDADWPAVSFANEWQPARLNDLTISTGTGSRTVTLPAGAVTLKGILTVNAGQTLNLGTNTLTASGASKAHVVTGTLSNGTFDISGASASLTGSTVTANAAAVNNLTLSGASVSSSNIKTISGNLVVTGASVSVVMNATTAVISGSVTINTTNAGDPVTLTMVATTSTHTLNLTVTKGALTYTRGGSGQQNIGGTVTLTAGSLILGTNVDVTGATSIVAGNLELGTFTYTQLGSGAAPDFIRTGAGTVSGTGIVKFDATAAAIDITPGTTFSLGNVTLVGAANGITFNAAMTISGTFVHTSGATTLSGNLTLSGSTFTFTAGSFAGAGVLNITGTPTITAAADMTVAGGFTINSTGTVTFRSSAESTPTKRLFTSGGPFTQTAGDVDLGINDLVFTYTGGDAYVRTAGAVNMGTGTVKFTGGAAQTFKPGVGLSLKNLAIATTVAGVTNSEATDNAMTVTGTLTLAGTGAFVVDASKLVLADGSTIDRQLTTSTLTNLPAFGVINVTYSGTEAAAITTAKELPATVNNLTVNRSVGGGVNDQVDLAANLTVNGTLYLQAGLLDEAGFAVTIGAGGTLQIAAGDFEGTDSPTVTSYNLVYSGGAAVTSKASHLQSGTGITLLGLSVTGANTVLTPHASLTVTNVTLNASGGGIALNTNAAVRNLTVTGNLTFTAGNFSTIALVGAVSAKPKIAFGGTAAQTLTVPSAGVVLPNGNDANADGDFIDVGDTPGIDGELNNTATAEADRKVTLGGGNFAFGTGGSAIMTSGVFVTGSNVLTLVQANNPSTNQPTQGFTRNVSGTNFSHVVGNVKKYVNNTAGTSVDRSIVTFPVGSTPASPGYYRPYSIYFKTAPGSAVNVTVSAVDSRPGGANGFPIRDGGLVITNYPSFFWYVKSDISLAPSYLFDMEAQAEGYADYAADGIQNLRFVRRDSGLVSNQWVMQKNNNTGTVLYDNSTIAASWPAVKVIDATGGITTQGSIFSFSQINKAPAFAATPASQTVNEGDVLSLTFSATDPDLGDLVTLSSVVLPTGATFNAVTGVFAWTVPYTMATAAVPTATAAVTIRATDFYGPLSADKSITLTINNVNRKPDFAATGAAKLAATTIKDGQALSFSYVAVDIDADAVTYVGVGLPTGATVSTAGALAWTPTFAQAGSNYTITVVASDGALTDTASAVVTVNRSVARGDVDKNGAVQAADASVVLQHVAGLTTITDAAALYAADASVNGTISAYDAALILQAAAGLITLPAEADLSLGKTSAVDAAGSLSWASPEATNEADVVKVNLNIANSANVYAVQLSSKVDANLFSIAGVSASLPEGWEMQWNTVDNELRVAMAGATPMPSGIVTSIMVRMKSRESRLSFSTDAMLNENLQSLGAVEIAAVPTVFALALNYPNPFNPSTTIKYQIAIDANVNLDVYNLQGQKIRTLIAKEQKAGYYSVVWDGRNEAGQTVSSGLYLYRVQAGSFVATHKMLMIK